VRRDVNGLSVVSNIHDHTLLPVLFETTKIALGTVITGVVVGHAALVALV
jgi:hypothetical protein